MAGLAAAAAGAVLMDRYERLERIDLKSARDVVTEADHLSEELVIAAIRQLVAASPERRAPSNVWSSPTATVT